MLIVDSQVHIWAADSPERPWALGKFSQAGQPVFGKTELSQQMAEAGIDRVVLVPPMCEGFRNDLALDAAQAEPGRFAVMGRLDYADLNSRGRIMTWRDQPGMLGLRYHLAGAEMQSVLASGAMDWVWREAEQAGVPVYVYLPHSMMPIMDAIAERHPRLRIVLDHMGLGANKRDEEAYREFDKALALAKRPNVAGKLSALPCTTGDVYPYRKLHPYIRKAYDAFGPKRLFWGTDYTRMRFAASCSYRQAVTMYTEEIPWLNTEDKKWIMGRGVCEWLGWKSYL